MMLALLLLNLFLFLCCNKTFILKASSDVEATVIIGLEYRKLHYSVYSKAFELKCSCLARSSPFWKYRVPYPPAPGGRSARAPDLPLLGYRL